jgi:hypothetical protein
MLSALTASLFAVVSRRRLLVDWRDAIFTGRSDSAPDLFSQLFVSPLADPLPERIEAASVAPALWRNRLDEQLGVVGRDYDPLFYKKFGSFRHLSISLKQADYPEELLVFWSWREVMRPLRSHLVRRDRRYRGMTNLEILREAANSYLRPSERIQALIEQFVGQHFSPKMLGLHVRATDLRAPVDRLIDLATHLVREHSYDGMFCATDNAEVEDRIRRLAPNVVTLTKQFPKGAVPLHYNPDAGDRLETATQALMDMLLLARCQNIVYAGRSSFGYVASLYAENKRQLVDVDRYNPTICAKRYLQSWIY